MTSFFVKSAAWLLKTLSNCLPKHTKRLVLWSTLYGMMCGQQRFTEEQRSRLNGALTLCKDREALDLPASLGKFIWKDLDGCTKAAKQAIRGERKAEEAALEFVRSIPKCLRYASEAFMLKDFTLLLATHRRAMA